MPNTEVKHNEAPEAEPPIEMPRIPVVDIETAPLGEAAVEPFFDWSPPKNWKDEEKIEAKRKEELAKFVQEGARWPATGRVIAIGYYYWWEDPDKRVFIDLAKAPVYEERVITKCLKLFSEADPWGTALNGYNFLGFDLPFLMARARILNLPILDRLPDYKVMKQQVGEVMAESTGFWNIGQQTSFWPAGTAKLKNMAKIHGCASGYRKDECDSAEFAECIMSEDSAEQAKALNHLTADLQECYHLAARARMPL